METKLSINRRDWIGFCIAVLLLCSSDGRAQSSTTQGLPTVEEAYRSVPHRRTVFSKDITKMDKGDAALLAEYFALIDRGIVLKVSATGKIDRQQGLQSEMARYESLIGDFKQLEKKFPKPFVSLARQAVEDQRDFFQTWLKDLEPSRWPAASRELKDRMDSPLIGSSSGKLIQAYQEVLASYPKESEAVKEAFFDYHCALDFK